MFHSIQFCLKSMCTQLGFSCTAGTGASGSLAWRERNLPPPKLPLPSYMYKVDLILIRLNAHFVENTQRVFTTTKIGLFSIHYCPKNNCSSCHRFVAMMRVKTKIVIRARNQKNLQVAFWLPNR